MSCACKTSAHRAIFSVELKVQIIALEKRSRCHEQQCLVHLKALRRDCPFHRRLWGTTAEHHETSRRSKLVFCKQTLPVYAILRRIREAWSDILRAIEKNHVRGYYISNQVSDRILYKYRMFLLFFRVLLPNPNHSVFPGASEAGVGSKGDRAHFPGVIASTAPSTELFVTKPCQRVGQQRPCPPTEAGKRRGERKEGWKALGKLHLFQHTTVCGQVCRSCKGSLQVLRVLHVLIKYFSFQSRRLYCEMHSKVAALESSTFSSTLKW